MAWMKRRDNSGGAQKDYLNEADTAGRPMALASILFTLLFIAAIALLLFSVGRWAYNQMIDEEVSVSTTQQEEQNTEESTGNVTVETTPDSATTSGNNNSNTTANEGSSTPAATNTNTSTSGAVPNTGPGSLLGVFVVTVILATGIHYRYLIVKNR